MGIGASVFLIAVGAILAFAVELNVNGLNIPVVGIILMIAGAIGLVTSLYLFGSRRNRDDVVEERAYRDRDPYRDRDRDVY